MVSVRTPGRPHASGDPNLTMMQGISVCLSVIQISKEPFIQPRTHSADVFLKTVTIGWIVCSAVQSQFWICDVFNIKTF